MPTAWPRESCQAALDQAAVDLLGLDHATSARFQSGACDARVRKVVSRG